MTTRDVDLYVEPDSDEIWHALTDARDRLDLSIERASPLDFLPELDGWRERSPWVADSGAVTIRHMDFRMQALAKLSRSLDVDVGDVAAMLEAGLVAPTALRDGLAEMEPRLFRFPQVDGAKFAARVDAFLSRYD